jgi:aminoglycoside phosphotransferase (APT) family kinase protein
VNPIDHVEDLGALASRAVAGIGVLVEPLEWFEYAKSSPIYTSVLETSAGEHVDVVVKDVSRASLLEGAAAVKPADAHDPCREAAVYRHVLAGRPGPPVLYGAATERDRSVLVLERVAGLELRDVGDVDVWARAAAWFGAFAAGHVAASPTAALGPRASRVPLARMDVGAWVSWRDRAEVVAARLEDPAGVRDAVAVFDERACELLVASPAGVVHGEAYPSNIVVAGPGITAPGASLGVRVAPLDWETAAFGPVLVDLAALTTGDWDRADQDRVTLAYRDAAAAGGLVFDDFDVQLAACRLGLALVWLAWFADHAPPAHQARDWASEAVAAAAALA